MKDFGRSHGSQQSAAHQCDHGAFTPSSFVIPPTNTVTDLNISYRNFISCVVRVECPHGKVVGGRGGSATRYPQNVAPPTSSVRWPHAPSTDVNL